jgi:hypothetical protein
MSRMHNPADETHGAGVRDGKRRQRVEPLAAGKEDGDALVVGRHKLTKPKLEVRRQAVVERAGGRAACGTVLGQCIHFRVSGGLVYNLIKPHGDFR